VLIIIAVQRFQQSAANDSGVSITLSLSLYVAQFRLFVEMMNALAVVDRIL